MLLSTNIRRYKQLTYYSLLSLQVTVDGVKTSASLRMIEYHHKWKTEEKGKTEDISAATVQHKAAEALHLSSNNTRELIGLLKVYIFVEVVINVRRNSWRRLSVLAVHPLRRRIYEHS